MDQIIIFPFILLYELVTFIFKNIFLFVAAFIIVIAASREEKPKRKHPNKRHRKIDYAK